MRFPNYSTDQRQGILRLCFDRGSASYEPRSTRGETRRNRGLNEALPRSNFPVHACKRKAQAKETRLQKNLLLYSRPAHERERLMLVSARYHARAMPASLAYRPSACIESVQQSQHFQLASDRDRVAYMGVAR